MKEARSVSNNAPARRTAASKPRWYWVSLAILLLIIGATAYPAFTQHPHQPALEDFFPTVIFDGVLPRKTFSMGEAQDKRFYLEARKIRL